MEKAIIYKSQEQDLKKELEKLNSQLLKCIDENEKLIINKRISEINNFLEKNCVSPHPTSNKITFGSLFSYIIGNKKIQVAVLVTENHLPLINSSKIYTILSNSSLGKAFLGRKENDSFAFCDGNRFFNIRIVKVYDAIDEIKSNDIEEDAKTYKKTA